MTATGKGFYILSAVFLVFAIFSISTHAADVGLAANSATCDGTLEGSMRWNDTDNVPEFCNGTEWSSVGGSAGCDSSFSSVVLLLHGDGTDASTTITDSSGSGHTITVNADAQLDTAQKKFGTASILFDGVGDHITTPDSGNWDFGTGDLTIELWVRFNDTTNRQDILGRWNGSATWVGTGIMKNTDHTFNAFFRETQTESPPVILLTSTTTASTGTWYHIATTRSGNTWRLFVNGTEEASATSSISVYDASEGFEIGNHPTNTSLDFDGWIDDLRITKGVARYTGNFTPPTTAFCDN